jgi:hypothetical protein
MHNHPPRGDVVSDWLREEPGACAIIRARAVWSATGSAGSQARARSFTLGQRLALRGCTGMGQHSAVLPHAVTNPSDDLSQCCVTSRRSSRRGSAGPSAGLALPPKGRSA